MALMPVPSFGIWLMPFLFGIVISAAAQLYSL